MGTPSHSYEQVRDAQIALQQHRPDERDHRWCATCPNRTYPCERRRAAYSVVAAAGATPVAVTA